MPRRIGGFLLVLGLFGLLAGCGLRMFAQRDPWRAQAEEACLARHEIKPSAYVEPIRSIDGPGVCGMEHPFRFMAFAEGEVSLKSKVVLACPAASMVDRWLTEVVRPAARIYFGMELAGINAGAYSCRSMNNVPGAHISEHAFGNALDLMGIRLADGRDIGVERGWKGDPAEQDFFREIFIGACRYFTTVLAPGSDAHHYNHIHMDLARHYRGRRICKPLIKFAPRLPAEGQLISNAPAQSPVYKGGSVTKDAPDQEDNDPLGAEADETDVSMSHGGDEGSAHEGSKVPASPASSLAPLPPVARQEPVAPAPRYSTSGYSAAPATTTPQYQAQPRPAPAAPVYANAPPARPAYPSQPAYPAPQPNYAPTPPGPTDLRPPGMIGGGLY
jgi:hypothetical protein